MSTAVFKWSQNSVKDFVNIAIVIFFMFIFRLICPPFGPVTEVGVGILGVFLGCIYGWTFCDLFWPSLLCLFAIQFTGYQTMVETLTVSFTSNPFMTMVFFFPVIYILEKSGIVRYFAIKLVGAKINQGRPWLTCFMLVFAAEIASSIDLYIGIFLVWALLYEIVSINNIPKGKFTEYMVVGIAFAACMGGSIFAFSPGVLAPMGAYEAATGNVISQAAYLAYAFPTITLFNVFFILAGKYILRIDLKSIKLDASGIEAMKLDGYQKFTVGILIALIVMLLLPSFLPHEWAFIGILHALGTKGVPGLLLVFMAIINATGGTTIGEAFSKGENWSVIMMIAAIMALGGAIKSDAGGIAVLLSQTMNAIFEGKSVVVFVIAAVFLSSFVTNFCNNLVVGMLFITIVANGAEAIGANGLAMALIICQTMNACMMTPAGGASAAILFGNKEWINPKHVMAYGVLIWLIVATVCCISYPYANLLV